MPETCPLCRGATVKGGGVHPTRGALMPMYECHACGRYYVSTPQGLDVLGGLSDDDRFTLAALARQASDARAPLELLSENVREVIAAAPRPTLSDRLDRLLLLLAQRAMGYLGPITVNKDHDFPLVHARGPRGMNELQVIAMKLGLLDENPNELRLTIKAWDRID